MWLDTRIPVRLVAPERLAGELAADPEAAAVVEEGVGLPPGALAETFPSIAHPVGCGCCIGRSVAAQAFDRLFLARVAGKVAFFRHVLAATATEAGAQAIATALREDPVVPMRYRLA